MAAVQSWSPGLAAYRRSSPWFAALAGLVLYAGCITVLLALLPGGLPREPTVGLFAAVGVIGVWRWSWGGLHLLRALLWSRVVFPRLRRRADAAPRARQVAVLVTSYRMTAELNVATYTALFDEIARYGAPAFIVACMTDPADAHLLSRLFDARHDMPPGTRMLLLPQDGTGKRGAMAAALRAIARGGMPPDGLLVLMDGDTLLPPGSLGRTAAVLMCSPEAGGVTADNTALVKGHALTREWYKLRLAHRHSLMCSMSLSGRVLVLTGRFSIIRAGIATDPGFVSAIAEDSIQHKRLGTIRMVTGDDKSTWFFLLKQGWRMLYVPDVAVFNVEELPGERFIGSSVGLMRRWYGNMARNNARALRLGPGRVGLFPWLCLLDQRISPWTSLVGITTALAGCLLVGWHALVYYALWVLVTRLVVCMIYLATTGRFHPLFPMILYYHQLVGAWVKIWAFYHPDRQGWNRQKLAAGQAGNRMTQWGSTASMAVSVALFVLAVGLASGLGGLASRHVPATGIAALAQGSGGPVQISKRRNSAY